MRRRLLVLTGLLIAVLLVGGGCALPGGGGGGSQAPSGSAAPSGGGGEPVDSAQAEPEPGVDPVNKVVKVGAFVPETGPVPFYLQITQGAQAYFNMVNDQGGINGWKIEYVTRDDGYQPARSLAVTKQLVEQDKIFALVAPIGTPTNVATRDYVLEQGIPAVGAVAGDPSLPTTPNYFILLVSYQWEAQRAAEYALDELGTTRIAVLYQNDALGQPALDGVVALLKSRNMEPVATIPFDVTEVDFSSYVANLSQAGADAVILWGSNRHLAAATKEAEKIGYEPAWFAPFYTADKSTFELGGDSINGVYFTSWLYPLDSDLEAVREFKESFARYFPDTEPGVFHQNGWSQGALFGKGLELVTNEGLLPTRQGLIAALETIRDEPIGLVGSVTFVPGDHEGTKKMAILQAQDGRIVMVDDFKPLPMVR